MAWHTNAAMNRHEIRSWHENRRRIASSGSHRLGRQQSNAAYGTSSSAALRLKLAACNCNSAAGVRDLMSLHVTTAQVHTVADSGGSRSEAIAPCPQHL